MYGWDGCRLAAAVGAADMTMDKMQGVVLLHAQHANQVNYTASASSIKSIETMQCYSGRL
jgi:hypothetical protein